MTLDTQNDPGNKWSTRNLMSEEKSGEETPSGVRIDSSYFQITSFCKCFTFINISNEMNVVF
jgi:hypothetical protein